MGSVICRENQKDGQLYVSIQIRRSISKVNLKIHNINIGYYSNLYLIRTILLYIDKLKADFVDNLILSNNTALFYNP